MSEVGGQEWAWDGVESVPTQFGRDAFHRVPFFTGKVGDAVERVPTACEERFLSRINRRHTASLDELMQARITSLEVKTAL